MIYLITGKPNTGKSTAIHKIVDMLGRKRCSGLLAEEILENNERVGFSACGIQSNKKITMAHKNIDKEHAVEAFGVDLKALEELLDEEFSIGSSTRFIIVDEIGRMQVMSRKFMELLDRIADSNKNVVGTICYEDEIEYIKEFKNKDNVELVVLDENNRDDIPLEIVSKLNRNDALYLSKIELAKKYASESERYKYYDDKVILKSTHDSRIITKENGIYCCTCDYYKDNGVCSHILSLLIK